MQTLNKRNKKRAILFIIKILIIASCFYFLSTIVLASAEKIMTMPKIADTPIDTTTLEKFKHMLAEIKQKVQSNIPLTESDRRFFDSFYPTAFIADQSLKSRIQEKNARLRSFSFSLVRDFPVINNIFEEGDGLLAHGSRSLADIFNIFVDGTFCSRSYGSLVDGPSSYSSGNTGPYFVILDNEFLSRDQTAGGVFNIPGRYHVAYLVPTEDDKLILMQLINRAQEQSFINTKDANSLKNKLLTFDQLWSIILQHKKLKGEDPITGHKLKEYIL
ncbi:MAG: hypothetical protein HQK53_18165 [Oligoflexia bacterium]|nr:hypothetical protein [Oligoflexia bacterium]